jgi:dihydroflavonol-4-reductase
MAAELTGATLPRFVCPLWLARFGTPFVAAAGKITGRRPIYTAAAVRALGSNRNISHDKASRELGYQPRPFRETLADTLAWFQENGYLGKAALCRS